MTTELVWSTVKPTFEEVKGKEVKFIWRQKSDNRIEEGSCHITSLLIYRLVFDDMFICYADLTAPVSPLPLWGKLPEICHITKGFYAECRITERDDYFSVTTWNYSTEAEAILAWNRIAEALDEVER